MSLKEAKIKFVVDVATNLFQQHSINTVTIKDIAEEAGIGEATIYRYFSNKENIIMACINKLMETVARDYFKLSKLNVLKLPRGYVFDVDYIKNVDSVSDITIKKFNEEEFQAVCDAKSFSKINDILKNRIIDFHLNPKS